MRVPFAPKLSARAVHLAAMWAAGVAFSPAVLGGLRQVGAEYAKLGTLDVLPAAALGAVLLAYVVARAGSVAAVVERSVLGGALVGLLATAAVCLRLTWITGRVQGRELDFALGATAGLVFGLVSSFASIELVRARGEGAHASLDVQVVNTGAWLAVIASASAVAGGVAAWSIAPVVVAASATLVAVLAAVRFHLRRRWLRRVWAYREPGWEMGPLMAAGAATLPALERLSPWSEGVTVIRLLPAEGPPYRTAQRRVPLGRVVVAEPDW